MAAIKYDLVRPQTTIVLHTPLKMQPLKYKINDRVKERTSNKVHGGFVNNQRESMYQ